MKISINSLKDTQKIGEAIGLSLMPGGVVCLDGDLGAGKTTLTQSIAAALGVREYVTSPTFTIIKEYEGRLRLCHMDVYRIDSPDDMYDLGFDEYIYSDGVTVIEWSDKIKDMLPSDRVDIIIDRAEGQDHRVLAVSGRGRQYEATVEALKSNENISD